MEEGVKRRRLFDNLTILVKSKLDQKGAKFVYYIPTVIKKD